MSHRGKGKGFRDIRNVPCTSRKTRNEDEKPGGCKGGIKALILEGRRCSKEVGERGMRLAPEQHSPQAPPIAFKYGEGGENDKGRPGGIWEGRYRSLPEAPK